MTADKNIYTPKDIKGRPVKCKKIAGIGPKLGICLVQYNVVNIIPTFSLI
jgi:hypothetical protein